MISASAAANLGRWGGPRHLRLGRLAMTMKRLPTARPGFGVRAAGPPARKTLLLPELHEQPRRAILPSVSPTDGSAQARSRLSLPAVGRGH